VTALHAMLASVGLSWVTLGLIVAIVALSAFMRGLTGFGFAIAAVPLMSLVIDPKLAVAITVVLPVPSGLMDLPKAWPASHRPAMIRLIAGALIGTPLGMLVLRVMPADVQRIVIAASAILALLAVWLLKKPSHLGLLARPTPAGISSGVLNGLAGMPGPPVVAYLLTIPITPAAARSSLIVFFLATGIFATVSGIVTGVVTVRSALISAICLAPFVVFNRAGGQLFHSSRDPTLYRRAALLVLAAGAASAAWKGVAGLL
jgi:uncharacterized membrane protein YfcA